MGKPSAVKIENGELDRCEIPGIRFPKAWCQKKSFAGGRPPGAVCLAEPSMPRTPLGGRLREADTRACLVVSPVFVAWRQKTQRVSAILAWRRGRHTNVPRPAPSGQAGLGRAATIAAR